VSNMCFFVVTQRSFKKLFKGIFDTYLFSSILSTLCCIVLNCDNDSPWPQIYHPSPIKKKFKENLHTGFFYVLIFGPKWSLYYLNAHSYNELTAVTNKYGWFRDVRYNRVWLCLNISHVVSKISIAHCLLAIVQIKALQNWKVSIKALLKRLRKLRIITKR